MPGVNRITNTNPWPTPVDGGGRRMEDLTLSDVTRTGRQRLPQGFFSTPEEVRDFVASMSDQGIIDFAYPKAGVFTKHIGMSEHRVAEVAIGVLAERFQGETGVQATPARKKAIEDYMIERKRNGINTPPTEAEVRRVYLNGNSITPTPCIREIKVLDGGVDYIAGTGMTLEIGGKTYTAGYDSSGIDIGSLTDENGQPASEFVQNIVRKNADAIVRVAGAMSYGQPVNNIIPINPECEIDPPNPYQKVKDDADEFINKLRSGDFGGAFIALDKLKQTISDITGVPKEQITTVQLAWGVISRGFDHDGFTLNDAGDLVIEFGGVKPPVNMDIINNEAVPWASAYRYWSRTPHWGMQGYQAGQRLIDAMQRATGTQADSNQKADFLRRVATLENDPDAQALLNIWNEVLGVPTPTPIIPDIDFNSLFPPNPATTTLTSEENARANNLRRNIYSILNSNGIDISNKDTRGRLDRALADSMHETVVVSGIPDGGEQRTKGPDFLQSIARTLGIQLPPQEEAQVRSLLGQMPVVTTTYYAPSLIGPPITGDDPNNDNPITIHNGRPARYEPNPDYPQRFPGGLRGWWIYQDNGQREEDWDTRKCLSPHTKISTLEGRKRVCTIKVGDIVLTDDGLPVKVKKINKERAINHKVLKIKFDDGAILEVSALHPTADGRQLKDLAPGDIVDSRKVVSIKTIKYRYKYTYDILPDSPTGNYYTNGILIGSTLSESFMQSMIPEFALV